MSKNPTGSNVTNGVKVLLEGDHDGVIAIGGGSGWMLERNSFFSSSIKPFGILRILVILDKADQNL